MAKQSKKAGNPGKNKKQPDPSVFICDEKGCDYKAKAKGSITAHWNKVHRKPHGQKRSGTKRKSNLGPPKKKTPNVVGLLVAAFNNGLSVTDACKYAGINRDTYYAWLKEDTDFSDKMDQARVKLGFRAREVIAQKIFEGNERVAMWWLERRVKDEFSTRKEVTGDDGGPIKTENKELSLDVPVTEKELDEALFGEYHQS
jgi:hypothetical protein